MTSLVIDTDSPAAAALTWHRGFGTDRYAFGRNRGGIVKIVHLGYSTGIEPLVLVEKCDATGMPERTIGVYDTVSAAIAEHEVTP